MTAPDPLQALTAALVESNDRLGGLLKLTEVHSGSLDAEQSLRALLESAVSLTTSDGGSISAGTPHRIGAARHEGDQLIEVVQEVSSESTLTVQLWRRGEAYRTPCQKMLAGVANLAASAVQTAELHQEALARELTMQEHATAARLVTAALPNEDRPPEVDGVSAFARTMPARMAGGDLFTWMAVDGDLWFAVGDVSGKGLPAAVQMATAVSAIENAMRRYPDREPAAVLSAVQRWIHERLSDSGMFLTVALGRWQPAERRLDIANAGHSPVLFVTNNEAERVEATAPPIGVLEDASATLWSRTAVAPGAVVALGSDGLTEEIDPSGQLFGEDHFDAVVQQSCAKGSDAAAIGLDILGHIDRHAQGGGQTDDRTLMILRFDDHGQS